MRKPISLSFLLLVGGLFLSPAQATNLDDVEVCPSLKVLQGTPETINPLAPREATILKVGYTCKVPTVETRRGSNEGYKPTGDVQWTLVKIDGGKQIWAAHTLRWGPVYVGYVEPAYVSFDEAVDACYRQEDIEINGVSRRIQMSLPGPGYGISNIDFPLNFELLRYLNYTSVVGEHKEWYWTVVPYTNGLGAYGFNAFTLSILSLPGEFHTFWVRCMGLEVK